MPPELATGSERAVVCKNLCKILTYMKFSIPKDDQRRL